MYKIELTEEQITILLDELVWAIDRHYHEASAHMVNYLLERAAMNQEAASKLEDLSSSIGDQYREQYWNVYGTE